MIEELTEELRQAERAAYEKLIRVMSHEVNNTVASSTSLLQSSLTYAGELAARAGATSRPRSASSSRARPAQHVHEAASPTSSGCRRRRGSHASSWRSSSAWCALLSARPDAAGIAWRWELDAPSIRVHAIAAQMEQAILNVVKNAVEAVDGTGDGHDPVDVEDGPPTLVVEDSGAGLTPEAQANLFTPFFSTKPHGQGIGLTLVGEILAGHGFDYDLERTARDTTAFRITFT